MNLLDLVGTYGLKPKWIAGTQGGEYHSACPECGGNDRFYIHPNKRMKKCYGSYKCRKCSIYGDSIGFAIKYLNYSYSQALENFGLDGLSASAVKSFNRSYGFLPSQVCEQNDKWIDKAQQLVTFSHSNLLKNPEKISYLSNRGLDLDTIKKFRIGWTEKDYFSLRAEWGLGELQGKMHVWIPSGIVIPIMNEKNNVIRLKIRRDNIENSQNKSRYVCVTGSSYGMNMLNYIPREMAFVVESELDGIAVYKYLHDMANIICIGGSVKNPDGIIHRLLEKCNKIYMCHDNDEAGLKVFNKWRFIYKNVQASPMPIGKDVGEAIQLGLNIEEWLFKLLLF